MLVGNLSIGQCTGTGTVVGLVHANYGRPPGLLDYEHQGAIAVVVFVPHLPGRLIGQVAVMQPGPGAKSLQQRNPELCDLTLFGLTRLCLSQRVQVLA